MVYWIVWFLTKIIRPLFLPLKVYGYENIPPKGSFILVSNHRSHLDPMIIPICIKRRISFLAKKSLFENKFLGWLLPKLEAYPIKRETSDFGALRGVLRRVKNGLPVLIFPEGTRVIDETKRKVQPGVGLIALKSKVPIVPMYILGTNKAFPPKSRIVKRHLVEVRFGKSFNLSEGLSNIEAANKIMDKILELKP